MRQFVFSVLSASSLVAVLPASSNFVPSASLGPITDAAGPLVWPSPRSFHPSHFPLVYGEQLTPEPSASASSRSFNVPPTRSGATRRRRRRLRRPRLGKRQGSGAPRCGPGGVGECRNFMGCMMVRRRLDWRSGKGICNKMFHVCCIPPSPRPQPPRRQPNRQARRRPKKSGRALQSAGPPPVQTPSVIKYYTSPEILSQIDFTLNNLEDGSTNQWHTHSVVASDGVHCGVSKNAQSKIMGGLDAGYGQFPWTAHIKIKGPGGIDKVCGGTLVNSRWVVTAGHCTQYCQDSSASCSEEVSQLSIQYKVIMGEYDQLSQLEEYPTESYLAVEVIRHPQYKNVKRYHHRGYLESEPRFDVALLKLDRNVRVAPSVAPICLPTINSGLVVRPGTLATVVGWGRMGQEEDSPHSNILQAVTIPVLGEEDCAQQTGLGVYSDQLCAGGTDALRSACPGDSGGGLQVRDDEGRWTLVGVVSNGPSTCGAQPVIFHKIRESLPWMVRTMRKRTLDHINILKP